MSNNQIQLPGMITPAGSMQEGETAVSATFAQTTQPARPAAVRRVFGAATPQPELSGSGFTYRHDWGSRRGQWVLRLDWPDVGPRSQVFVSVGEGVAGGTDAGKFIGAARYTVHNVAPRAGGVDIWVNIEWEADIPLYADYLVVNPGDVGGRTVQITVQRHGTVALSDADADRILADMGTILQSDDSPADVATPVQFVRNGPVQVLPPNVPATIQTEADLLALLNAGSGVKIVEAIRWCGGPGGSIIGCAPLGSPTVNLAAVRFTANQEGLIWVHEYGHNAGLGHRTDDPRAVMYPSVGVDHNVVNEAESASFLTGPVAARGAPMASSCSLGAAIQPPQDVRAFVSQHWIQGIPYQAASQYTEEDAKLLLEWLVDEPEKHEEFLPEIVTTLGFIGSEIAAQPLIDFVQQPRASRATFNAKNAALIHLGDLINKSGSQAALDFITRVATDREMAKQLAVHRSAIAAAEAAVAGIDARNLESLAAELAVSATFGLALAGKAESEGTLMGLMKNATAFPAVKVAAMEAAVLSQKMRSQGQETYYSAKCEGGQQQ
ncbi:hypothetical protein [Massilia sp. Leaf139]|uniref:hypothetical protein n=1 Tax=Massilia sp. Leaf139 TaxID=1736272 RepID=UPI000A688AC9|nr:hypothetical protein [Massilia sp. Leaf139]